MKLRRIYSKHYEISFTRTYDDGSKQVVREGLTNSVYVGEQPTSEVFFEADEWFVEHHSSKLYDIAGRKLAKDDYTNF